VTNGALDGGAPMRYFVDETSFELPNGIDPGALEEHLEAFIRLIRGRHAEDKNVFKWSELDRIEVQPGIYLCDLLYNQRLEQLPIDRDTRGALRETLNRCVAWDDRIESATDPHLQIDGVDCIAQTVAVVHGQLSAERGAVCLALGARPERTGVCAVRLGEVTRDIHFVARGPKLLEFYRAVFEIEDLDPDAYMEHATEAFPDLEFAPKLASQIPRFKTPYREIRPLLTKHLAVLNDHFQRVHRQHKDTTDDAIGGYGIDASSERGKTHKNKKAMKQRTLLVDRVEVVCEWHTKIKRYIDRVYFHPGDAKVAGGRLIVGFFTDHFDT
jgi:hypothetical protein